MVGTVETGVVLGLLVTVGLAVAGFIKSNIEDRISMIEDDVRDLSERTESRFEDIECDHEETRRLAEAAYSSVHGDEDRPEDHGYIMESREKREELRSDMENLKQAVSRIEKSQERHQKKTEIILDAMADEMDIDMLMRGGEGPGDGSD